MPVTEKGVLSSVRKLVFTWTADAGGAASVVTAYPHEGKLIGLTTIPSGGGEAPTDNYDLQLLDEDGHDVLLGAGANRDTANTEHVAEASLGAVCRSKLTLDVTNAGDSNGGTAIVYLR